MSGIEAPKKAKGENSYSGVYSKFPMGMVSDATLSMLDFELYEPTFTMTDPRNHNTYWKVYSPVGPRSSEVTVIEVPTELFGKTRWQAYVGEVEKPVFLETKEQYGKYLKDVQGIVQPGNKVEAGDLDLKLQEYASRLASN